MNSPKLDGLIAKYESRVLFQSSDYSTVDVTATAFQTALLPSFRKAARNAGSFPSDRRGEPACYVKRSDAESERTEQRLAREPANGAFHRLFNEILPTLAFGYHIPGTDDQANPYYQNPDVLQLYLSVLDYSSSRGLTEHAWLPDHAGSASAKALGQGLVRTSDDFSEVSFCLGGFSQGIFLMREPLADAGLLTKHRAVVRNLVVNHGVMYRAFFQIARKNVGVDYPNPLPIERQCHLSEHGMRLFVDYLWPYFLLIEETRERRRMAAILY